MTNQLENKNQNLQTVINDFKKLPSLKNLSRRQIEKIAKAAYIDSLKDNFVHEGKKDLIDKNKLKDKWLDLFDSSETIRSFKRNLEYFFSYILDKSILDVNALIVDDYLRFLKNSKTVGRVDRKRKLSDASIRQRIAACSSFWQALKRWEIVVNNPFKGCKLPKKLLQVKTPEQIPTTKQLNECEKYCRNKMKISSGKGSIAQKKSAKNALGALITLRETGLRVGALPTLLILEKGNYIAKTKGGIAKGKLKKNIISKLQKLDLYKRYPFKNYKSFSMYFYKMVRELDFDFSIHSIRHYFAIRYYKKNDKDIDKLRQAMGHKTTIPTMSYLSGKL